MRQLQQHLARRGLRMLEHFLDGQDWTGRNSFAIQELNPMFGWIRCERAIYFLGERGAIFYAAAAAFESLVAGEFVAADHLDEFFPHRFVAACDVKRPIRCFEDAVRRRQRMIVAGGRWRHPGLEINSRRPGQDTDDRLEQRGFDALAAAIAMARLECEKNSLRRENSAEQVANGDADPGRPALDSARHAHQTRHPLRYLIEAREVAQWAV